MVAGLKLQRELGYCRGAVVRVTDPSGHAGNVPWHFVVTNDEHATLTSKNPPPPQWIQPGVVIRIEVDAAAAAAIGERPRQFAQPPAATVRPPAADPVVTAIELADWRRAVLRILDRFDGGPKQVGTKGPAGRISDLSYAGKVPRHIAAMMRMVTEMRNLAEYEAPHIPADESTAVRAAWQAVRRWAEEQIGMR